MISLNKIKELPDFSRIIHNPNELARAKAYRPNYLPLGYVIYGYFKEYKKQNPKIELWQYVIMPDHIHFLINIKEELDHHLGNYIAGIKRDIYIRATQKGLVNDACKSIFEEGFNDQFLKWQRNLDDIFKYINENPYYLWIRQKNPVFFNKVINMELRGSRCSLYGNLRLLDNPFKYAVIVHISDLNSPEILRQKMEKWEYGIYNGGVLVGGFMNDAERAVMKKAIEWGGKIIKLDSHYLGKREKPSRDYLDLCKTGNCLIISPDMDLAERQTNENPGFWIGERGAKEFIGKGRIWGQRQKCLYNNCLAERLSFPVPALRSLPLPCTGLI